MWVRIVRDEVLCRSMMAGQHRAEAGALGLTPANLDILDEFAARPGTRWNIENLRYRATSQVAERIQAWMPMTVHALTGSNFEWLSDLAFEYLTHHTWGDLGALALTECERFGVFVRERVVLRRQWNPLLDPILIFELAVIALLKRTRDVAPDAWPVLPDGPLGDEAVDRARPRPGPVVTILSLPIDVRPWLQSAAPGQAPLVEVPTDYLLYVPSLRHSHKVQTISEGARTVFERCTGEPTAAEIATALEAEHDVDPAATRALLGRWLGAGALIA
jgi:hypothetical protein